MSKKIKDAFDAFVEGKDLSIDSIKVVDKTTEKETVTADAVIVNGSASKAAIYGDGEVVVRGWGGTGSVKSAAAIEVTAETAADEANIVIRDGVDAKLVAGAKVDFTADDKKYAPADTEVTNVTIASTSVTVLDAKAADVFGGAVTTDTASSKKAKVEVIPTVEKAVVNVLGGTVTNVYGGGTGISKTGDVAINISGGKVSNVYAGGAYGSDVFGDVVITVDMNSATGVAAMNIGTIYAGGLNANVFGDVAIVVTTNGAKGSAGKIGTINGAPAKGGVTIGSKDLVLENYHGDFATTVKNMDTVTISGDSAVTFAKGQDASMKNAEYIIEVAEASNNSNQAAILTLNSAYVLNKLTVDVDADLINAGGSFTRTLIAGVKGKFNSANYDVDQINVKTDDGQIADYQYELKFETVTDAKGKESETGKLIFTYTGAELEVSVDGYVNRHGVANVLSDANDFVTFTGAYDALYDNTNNVLDFNFKTMAGNDTVTIDANVYLNGKLSLGAGNDKLTINGALKALDLSGAGENTVFINGILDARNITTSADSVTTFVLNGAFDSATAGYLNPGDYNRVVVNKVVFYYEDGSNTENEIDKKKKVIYAETTLQVGVDNNGAPIFDVTKTPFTTNAEAERYLQDSTYDYAADGIVQDFVVGAGSNTLVVDNALGVADIKMGGKYAEVVLIDALNNVADIDLSKADSSKLVLEGGNFTTFRGSRKGENTVVIAKDYVGLTAAGLDIFYKNTKLVLNDAVVADIDTWDKAGSVIEKVTIGDNAVLTINGGYNAGAYYGNYTGYLYDTAANAIFLGTVESSVIDFAGTTIDFVSAYGDIALSNSALYVDNAAANVSFAGDIVNSVVEFEDAGTYNLELDDVVVDAASVISVENSALNSTTLNVTFRGDVVVDGILDIGAGIGNLTLQDANVKFANAIGRKEFIDNTGFEYGDIDITLVQSTLELAADTTVRNLTITQGGSITGEGKLDVTGTAALSGVDYTFGADEKLSLGNATAINFTEDSNVAVEEGFVVEVAGAFTLTNSTLTGNGEGAKVNANSITIADDVADDDVEVKDITLAVADGQAVAVTDATLQNVIVEGTVAANTGAVLDNVTADALTLGADVVLVGNAAFAETTTAGSTVNLADEAAVSLGDVTNDLTVEVVEGAASVTAGTVTGAAAVTANENEEVTFAADKVTGGLTATADAAVTAGAEDGKVNLAVGLVEGGMILSGAIDLGAGRTEVRGNINAANATYLAGADVRVYDYTAPLVPNGILVDDITLDGNFEADVKGDNGDNDNTIALTDSTKIVRNSDDAYNRNAYGTIQFGAGTDELNVVKADGSFADAVDGNYAEVEKEIDAAGDLTILGNIKTALVDVAGNLTLGRAGAPEDYVTYDPDANAAVKANVQGDIDVDGTLTAAADSTVTGAIAAGALAVNAGASFTQTGATEITGALTVAVDNTDTNAVNYDGMPVQDGGVAVFNGNVKAGSVNLEGKSKTGDVYDNAAAGASLTINGDLDVTATAVDNAISAGNKAAINVAGAVVVGSNADVVTAISAGADAAVAIGNIAVGTYKNLADEDVKYNNASVTLSGAVTVGGVALDAAAKNALTVNSGATVNGDIAFADVANNALTVADDAVVTGAVTVAGAGDLALSVKETATTVGLVTTYSSEFTNNITFGAGENTLTVSKLGVLGGTSVVTLGTIDFGGADDEDALTLNDTDTLALNTAINVELIKAAGNLTIEGNGTISGNVEIGGDLTIGDGVAGTDKVTFDNANGVSIQNITLKGGAVAVIESNVERALTEEEAKLNPTAVKVVADETFKAINGDLTVKANAQANAVSVSEVKGNVIVESLGLVADAALSINGGTTTETFVDKDGNAVGLAGVSVNRAVVEGNVDLSNAAAFGGKLEVKGAEGVKFNNLTLTADLIGNVNGQDIAGVRPADASVTLLGGQTEVLTKDVAGVNGNNLTLNDAKVVGTIALGTGADVIDVKGINSAVTFITMGDSMFNAEIVETDVIKGDSSDGADTLTVGQVAFGTATLGGNLKVGDLTIARDFAAFVAKVNEAFITEAAVDGVQVAKDDVAHTTTYTVTIDGVKAEFLFTYTGELTDGKPSQLPTDYTVSVSADATVVGSDNADTLTIDKAATIEGAVDLKAGADKLVLDANLTLSALADANELVIVKTYDVDGNLIGTIKEAATAENSNVFNFGAGADVIMINDNSVTITAAQILFTDTLTLTEKKDSAATLTIAGDIVAPGKTLTIDTDVIAQGKIDANIVFGANGSLTIAGEGALTGALNLESTLTYTAKDLEADPAIPADKAEFSGSDKLGAIKVGEGALSISNKVTAAGTKNEAALTGADNGQNSVGAITGTKVLVDAADPSKGYKNASDLTLSGQAVPTPSVDAKVEAVADLNVASIEAIKLLTINNGVNVSGNVSDISALVVSKDAELAITGAFSFTDMAVSGEGAVTAAALTGTVKDDKLVLSGDALKTVAVNFAGSTAEGADVLELKAAATVASITAAGALKITGTGALTGNVTAGSALEITGVTFAIGSGVTMGEALKFSGTLSSTLTATDGTADVLTLTGAATIGAIAKVETLELNAFADATIGAGMVDNLDFSDVMALFTDDTIANYDGKSFKVAFGEAITAQYSTDGVAYNALADATLIADMAGYNVKLDFSDDTKSVTIAVAKNA